MCVNEVGAKNASEAKEPKVETCDKSYRVLLTI